MRKILLSLFLLMVCSSLVSSALTTVGEQKTLGVLVNFNNANVPSVCTQAYMQNQLFTSPTASVNGMYNETSEGQTWFTGDVVGPYTINLPQDTSSNCNTFYGGTTNATKSWSAAVKAILTAQGIDVSGYTRILYLMPKSCGYGGLGYYPSTSPTATSVEAFNFYCNSIQTSAHELGHTMNLAHASTATSEYGDQSDIMGSNTGSAYYTWLIGLNAPHRKQLSWLPSSKILTISSSGIYTLSSLETKSSTTTNPQIIRIYAGSTIGYYYLSVRQPISYDSVLSTTYTRGLNIHKYTDPSGSTPAKPIFLQSLISGGSFTDSALNLTIKQIYNSTNTVTINISFATASPTCVRNIPNISLSPGSVKATPGTTANYQVNIKNNDNSNCPSTSFNIARVVPLGFTQSINYQSLTIAPGASSSALLSITSDSSLANGNYTFFVNTSSTLPIHSSSVSGKYNVSFIDSQAPSAPSNLQGSLDISGNVSSPIYKVQLSWNPSNDNIAISKYNIYRNNLQIASISSVLQSYLDTSVVAGTYSYHVVAQDTSSLNSSASNTISIQVTGLPVCTENWQCSEWGSCIFNNQTRTCLDTNNCGSTTNKPIESQACSCTPNWQCTAWNTCVNGLETRVCTDSNACGVLSGKPIESQSCPNPGQDNLIIREAESNDSSINRSGKYWKLVSDLSYSGGYAMQVLPNTNIIFTVKTNSSPKMDYSINFPNSGVYYVWVKSKAPSVNDNSINLGLNNILKTSVSFSVINSLSWSNTTSEGKRVNLTVSAGMNNVSIWMREDGSIVDKFLLTTNKSFIPSASL